MQIVAECRLEEGITNSCENFRPINMMKNSLSNLLVLIPRFARPPIFFGLDLLAYLSALFLGETLGQSGFGLHQLTIFVVVFGTLIAGRIYSRVASYRSTYTIWRFLLIASPISMAAYIGGAFVFSLPMSLSLILTFTILFVALGAFWRLGLMKILSWMHNAHAHARQVVIFGAGKAGAMLEKHLRQSPKYRPVAIVDDDHKKEGQSIGSCTVYSSSNLTKIINMYDADMVVAAIPSLDPSARRSLLTKLQVLGIEVLLIPELSANVNDWDLIRDFRPINSEDLLKRECVIPQSSLMTGRIKGFTVLITGAGGSIGSELVRQTIELGPKKVVLLERSELALYELQNELRAKVDDLQVRFVLGDVTNRPFISKLIRQEKVDTVFHAAAYKHVPMLEHNVMAGVNNNVLGTLYCLQAAVENSVSSFILISSDKAVRPTNVMGASKRVAEMVVQSIGLAEGETTTSIVRFGNVLGSSGSVVPMFEEQIKRDGPVTITHPDITRYFMTIEEAAQLVIQAATLSAPSDLFLLDMGEPVKIVDLAKQLIKLSGRDFRFAGETKKEGQGAAIEIVFTGLRPGEKLYEELLIDAEALTTKHPRIFRANERFMSWKELEPYIEELTASINQFDEAHIREILRTLVQGFKPEKRGRSVFEASL